MSDTARTQTEDAKRNSALKETPADGDGVNPNHPAKARDVVIVDAEAGVVTGTRKKIAICGFASSSRGLVPVSDPAWEVWGLNQLYRHIRRADRWFDIHRNWHEETVPGTDYLGWLAGCGIPFYMAERDPRIPTSVRYPVERLIDRFGVDYFTSTVAFMVALAVDEIDQRVDAALAEETVLLAADPASFAAAMARDPLMQVARRRQLYEDYMLGLFGIDLVVGEEYDWQKACAEFWIGEASARGIKVFLPQQSALCKQLYRYGYEAEPRSLIRESEVRKHMAAVQEERQQLMAQLYIRDGALRADEYWLQVLQLRARGAEVAV